MRNLAWVAMAGVLALGGCDRKQQQLSEKLESDNGLLTLHYPRGFSAKQEGKNYLVVAHSLPDGRDEAISFVAVPHPVSLDLAKFAEVVQNAGASKLNQYKLESRRPAKCSGNDGMEFVGTWVDAASGGTITRRSCAFLHGGHGYAFSYSIPQDLVASHDPLLHAIVEATELK